MRRPRFYRVRFGETLSDVAIRFDTTVEDLLALNPGIEPDEPRGRASESASSERGHALVQSLVRETPGRRRRGPRVRGSGLVGAPPQVSGRSYVVENGVTGEVLLARNARAARPDRKHHEADDGAPDARAHAAERGRRRQPEAAEVGESSADLNPGDRLTVRELLEAALIQSANDAADALAIYVGHGSESRFVAMMNARARQLGLARHPLRQAGRARRARPLSRAHAT